MKKYSKILKTSFVLFVVGILIVIITVFLAGGVYSFTFGNNGFNIYKSNFNTVSQSNLSNTGNVALDKFSSVDITSVNEDINFIPSNEYRIEYEIDEIYNLQKCTVENGELIFRYAIPKNQLHINSGFNLTIGPSAYTSGTINIYYNSNDNDNIFDDITLNCVSSQIDFGDVSFVDKLNINTVSNDVYIADVEFNEISLNMVSGDIEVNSNFNSCNINTTSGDVDIINLSDTIEEIEINSISSDINITLPSDNVAIDFTTVSGKGYINGEKFTKEYNSDNSNTDIDVSTVSGEFNFYY